MGNLLSKPSEGFEAISAQAQAFYEGLVVTYTVEPQTNGDRVPSVATTSGGFFSNATGFNIANSVMNENHIHSERYGPDVLEQMRHRIIPGTEYDSVYRDDPPKCHPNTRTRFLQQLQTRIHETDLTTRIVWLVGPAGVGKSAIMQSLAETVCPLLTLRCASLFFSRPNQRDDPKKVFTTLAYGFAVVDPEYRRYMGECLITDPMYLDKSLDEQFKRIFVLPFTSGRVSSGSRRWVVFLDGLDECNGRKEQSRIVDLVRESVLHHAQTMPFIWIVASRPEAHLQASFRRVEEEITHFWKLEVPIDSEEALQSMELFLREKFAEIRYNYSDIVPWAWPSENEFLLLMGASSGLFVFASTLVDYVGRENPVSRLKHVVSLITRSVAKSQDSSNEVKKNPFYALDILYSTIMSDVPLDSLPMTKMILGYYLLGNALPQMDVVRNTPDSFILVCNILRTERHDAYAALRDLHSTLDIPSPDDAAEKPVKFLHASFSDFLKDRSRSQTYFIDLDQELLNIWRRSIDIVKYPSSKGFQSSTPLSWEPEFDHVAQDVRRSVQILGEQIFISALIEYCHDSSRRRIDMKYHISPDTDEILYLFERLGPRLFTLVGSNKSNPFCRWLPQYAPSPVRQQVVLREFNLTRLNKHDLDGIFSGVCERKWAFYHTHNTLNSLEWSSEEFNLKNLDIDQWNQAKRLALAGKVGWDNRLVQIDWRFLANLLALHKNFGVDRRKVKVVVTQFKPPERCVIIGPLQIRIFDYSNTFLQYLVLPYAE